MKIGIDARFLGPQGTGLSRYVFELIKNLEKIDNENDYVIFLRSDNFDLYDPQNKRFKKRLAEIPWFSLKEQIVLPLIFLREKLDLLHVPFFNVPVLYPGKYVVTLHDLIKSEFAGLSATTKSPPVYFIKHSAYEAVLRFVIYRSKKIIVPSKYIKEKIRKRFNFVQDKKIIVTYESSFDNSGLNMSSKNDVLKKYNLNKPYLIYVGNAYPYKNLENLFQAIKILKKNSEYKELKFINPCARSIFYEKLEKRVFNLGLANEIILPGFVPDEDLKILYQNAKAYVFPSLSEGFGIPGLEAMSQKLPVVCSNIEVLKEIYGNAAVFFDPKSPKDIAQKIELVLTNDNLRKEMIQKGQNQVKKYSWEKMARQTLSIYKEIFAEK